MGYDNRGTASSAVVAAAQQRSAVDIRSRAPVILGEDRGYSRHLSKLPCLMSDIYIALLHWTFLEHRLLADPLVRAADAADTIYIVAVMVQR